MSPVRSEKSGKREGEKECVNSKMIVLHKYLTYCSPADFRYLVGKRPLCVRLHVHNCSR